MHEGGRGVPLFQYMIDIKLITPQMLPLSKIELNKGQIPDVPQNPRFIRDERYKKLVNSIETHPEMMGYRELWVFPFNGKYVIIGGNMRFRALRDLGYKEAPCKVLPPETPADDLRQFILLDNAEYGENDMDIMLNEFETADLELAGIDLTFNVDDDNAGNEDADTDEGNEYTLKIEPVSYTPTGNKPKICDCYNTEKRDELLREIDNAKNISPEIRELLMQATNRHIVFNYENIAELYAHSTKEEQKLMESSAMVIIDFNDAINNGFVKMSTTLQKMYANEIENRDDE